MHRVVWKSVCTGAGKGECTCSVCMHCCKQRPLLTTSCSMLCSQPPALCPKTYKLRTIQGRVFACVSVVPYISHTHKHTPLCGTPLVRSSY